MDRFSEVMKKNLKICFAFDENMKWYFVGQRGSNFNLRVIENRSSKHSFWLYDNDLFLIVARMRRRDDRPPLRVYVEAYLANVERQGILVSYQ